MYKIVNQLVAILRFIRKHKYISTTVVFVAFITFIDENNLIHRIKQNREIGQLRGKIEKYKKEYDESTRQLNELTENPEIIEKIAREKYMMKQPNEDIYVFEKE
ncbi:Cell division protein FtsL [termite gut metagenome]|uniref:Cell division protein FtsL n=1 Tax=termite gut metagenome TaxID=433724 RepID=A0A5J4R1E4_9ZZZZ